MLRPAPPIRTRRTAACGPFKRPFAGASRFERPPPHPTSRPHDSTDSRHSKKRTSAVPRKFPTAWCLRIEISHSELLQQKSNRSGSTEPDGVINNTKKERVYRAETPYLFERDCIIFVHKCSAFESNHQINSENLRLSPSFFRYISPFYCMREISRVVILRLVSNCEKQLFHA